MLTQTFAAIRRSVMAFASRAAVVTKNKKAPPFPTIIGTGFVIDRRGLVATNRHVVRRLERLPAHPKTGESAAFALAYSDVKLDQGRVSMRVVPIGIRRWDKLTTFNGDEQFYGERLPDLAFVQLNVSEIPAMSLVERFESSPSLAVGQFAKLSHVAASQLGGRFLRSSTSYRSWKLGSWNGYRHRRFSTRRARVGDLRSC